MKFFFNFILEKLFPLGTGRAWQIFGYFAETSVTSFLREVLPVIFRSTKFWLTKRLTKLQRHRRSALEQDKLLSGIKSDRFVNLQAMICRKLSIKKI